VKLTFGFQMKRQQPSGAANRAKKKTKDEDQKKQKGAMLKFLNSHYNSESEFVPLEEMSTSSHDYAVGQHDSKASAATVQSEDIDCDTAVPEYELKKPGNNNLKHDGSGHNFIENHKESDEITVNGQLELEVICDHNRNLMSSLVKPISEDLSIGTDIIGKSIPNLTDIAQWPETISDNLRVHLVLQGSEAVQNIDCQFEGIARVSESAKGKMRKLTKRWFYREMPNGEKVLRKWMCYSPKNKSLHCFCCLLFGSKTKDISAFASREGFNDWWRLSPRVKDHESSSGHQRSFLAWRELELRHRSGATIDHKAQEIIKKEQEKWRDVLKRILDIIRFLAKQNMALRGHREGNIGEDGENQGNFKEMVKLLSKYDPVLREHVLRANLGVQQTTYLSPQIQNEFIVLLGDHVRKHIINDVKQAKYYSIILDSTPDVSHLDQTSQVLRYVVMDGENGDVSVRESFIDFIDTKGKHAAEITTMILDKLISDGLDIANCRGQGYDNAAVMKGQHSGVQKRILEINPKAQFIACSNHSLNLAGIHAAQVEVNSVTFFGTLDRLHAFFSTSTHRWDVLTKTTGISVKRLVETRWSARGEAVKTVKNNFTKIIETLEILTGENENAATRSDAGILLTAMQSFSFISYLGFWAPVLIEINDAQSYLQKKGLSIRDCALKMKALKNLLTENREKITDNSIQFGESMCLELGITMEPVRRIRVKKKCPEKNMLMLASPSRIVYGGKSFLLRTELFKKYQLDFNNLTKLQISLNFYHHQNYWTIKSRSASSMLLMTSIGLSSFLNVGDFKHSLKLPQTRQQSKNKALLSF